jgi:hypothetical protein
MCYIPALEAPLSASSVTASLNVTKSRLMVATVSTDSMRAAFTCASLCAKREQHSTHSRVRLKLTVQQTHCQEQLTCTRLLLLDEI